MSRLKHKVESNVLGTRLFEHEFFNVENVADLYKLQQIDPSSWAYEFRSLEAVIQPDNDNWAQQKVAIATEDIVGPVRNGGIGTTYYYLAQLLSRNGFDVTILYLRGNHCEKKTIEYWIDHYQQMGIKFLPVPDYYSDEKINSKAKRWFAPIYNLYRHLCINHFDIVHVSEWRGSSYLSLIAKNCGIGLKDTTFLIKCSSPWMWNRLYGLELIRTKSELLKVFCEQKSVELGDLVIGGSAHLLRWMSSRGYQIGKHKTFVQPNVLITEHFDELINNSNKSYGDIIAVDEIVFFGRLEERKGLVEFCDALDILVEQNTLPHESIKAIAFMGKQGGTISSFKSEPAIEFIKRRSTNWGVEIKLLTEFQQFEALSYLMDGNKLAVMPSRIENSSLAVYECLLCKIPFLASRTGGTPELLEDEYLESNLFDTHPVPLAHSLTNVINDGVVVAHPTFSNDRNNDTWVKIHKTDLKKITTATQPISDEAFPPVDVFIYFNNDAEYLQKTLASISRQNYPNLTIYVLNEGDEAFSQKAIDSVGIQVNLKKLRNYGAGYAYNYCAKNASSELFMFLRAGYYLKENALFSFVNALHQSGADVASSFYEKKDAVGSRKIANLYESYNFNFYEFQADDLVILTKSTLFNNVGGFNSDRLKALESVELVNEMILNGAKVLTIPEFLFEFEPASQNFFKQHLKQKDVAYRTIRPYLIHSPSMFASILLTDKSTGVKSIKGLSKMLAKAILGRTKANVRRLYRLGRRVLKKLFYLFKRVVRKCLSLCKRIVKKLIYIFLKIPYRKVRALIQGDQPE